MQAVFKPPVYRLDGLQEATFAADPDPLQMELGGGAGIALAEGEPQP